MYRLIVENGKVEYLMRAGNDIVKGKTAQESAEWTMRNKSVSFDCIEEFPEYCIHAGDFYFRAEQEPKKSRKRRNGIEKAPK